MMAGLNKTGDTPLCPSARSNWAESQVFGVVGGTVETPAVIYLKETELPSEYLTRLSGTEITPEEVFRIAAPCEENSCQHFDGRNCRLATRIVDRLPSVAEDLPPCAIRRSCRWWQQEGRSACLRCPQVITDNYHPSELTVGVSMPQ
jgi:hypothetical protein